MNCVRMPFGRCFVSRITVWFCMALLVAVASPAAQAQTPELRLEGEERPVEVRIAPVYQRVNDGDVTLEAWSTAIQATVPIGTRTSAQARMQYAQASGNALTTVAGPTDLKLNVQHLVPARQGYLVLALDTNVPVGENELSDEELQTTAQTSQRPYRFQVPTFGQGWTVAPGLSWITPVSADLVLGMGLTGRYQGGYRPLAASSVDYVPGNEIEGQVGLDYRLSPASTVALDVTTTYFGTDTEGDLDRFEARYNMSVRAQYYWQQDAQTLRMQARYENWPESRFRPVLLMQDGVEAGDPITQQVLPSVWSGIVGYARTLTNTVHIGLRSDVQHYTATTRFDTATTVRIQLAPQLQFSTIRVGANSAYTFGSFTGFEVGLSTALRL